MEAILDPPGARSSVDPGIPASSAGFRVTVLVPRPPSVGDGAPEYAYRLAALLSARYRMRVVTTSSRGDAANGPLQVGSASVERLPAHELFHHPVLRREAWTSLRGAVLDADLVHLHMPFPFVERSVARWTRRAGVPLVITYHADADLGDRRGHPVGRTVTAGYRWLSAHPALRAATGIVTDSAGYAEASPVLSRHFAKVTVVRKGIDLDRLHVNAQDGRIAPRAEPGHGLLPDGEPSERRVLFAGVLDDEKGLPELLWATAILLKTGLPLRTYIAGRGPLDARLRRLVATMGLGDRVQFLGAVPDERRGELYRAMDVVTAPCTARLAATPASLEEAVACGTPVVGTSLPGNDEALPNDGVHGSLVPPGSVPALAQALRRLLILPRPHWKVPPRTWHDTAREYADLFDRLQFDARLAAALRLPREPSPVRIGHRPARPFKAH